MYVKRFQHKVVAMTITNYYLIHVLVLIAFKPSLCALPVNSKRCCSSSRVSFRSVRLGWTSCHKLNRSWPRRSQATTRACWSNNGTMRSEHWKHKPSNGIIQYLTVLEITRILKCNFGLWKIIFLKFI